MKVTDEHIIKSVRDIARIDAKKKGNVPLDIKIEDWDFEDIYYEYGRYSTGYSISIDDHCDNFWVLVYENEILENLREYRLNDILNRK